MSPGLRGIRDSLMKTSSSPGRATQGFDKEIITLNPTPNPCFVADNLNNQVFIALI